MSRQDKQFMNGLYLIGGGSLFLYSGLISLKARRKISDTPRSKISSAAVGEYVEVHGRIHCEEQDQITSHLTNELCAAFIWELEKEIGIGKDKSWNSLFTFYSTPFLYVHDEHHENEDLAAIDLASCVHEDSIETYHYFDDKNFDIPEKVKLLLKRSKMLDVDNISGGFLSADKYRLKQTIYKRNEDLYILGTAVSPPSREISFNNGKKLKFGSKFIKAEREISNSYSSALKNTYYISQYDQNKNSILDVSEKNKIYEDIKDNILTSYQLTELYPNLARAKICFTSSRSKENIFSVEKVIISHKSESDLSKSYFKKAIIGIVLGPLMIVLGLWLIYDLTRPNHQS